MPGLKKYFPDIRFGGNKVSPDEIDRYESYYVIHPSILASAYGTAKGTGDGAVAFTLTNTVADYPRNVLFTCTGVAGGEGGTVAVTGKNQFGQAITESIGFASANAGGTAAGTKIFQSVSAATATLVSTGGTGIGTASLGYANGTAAAIVQLFGLPVRIGAASDVKVFTYDNAGTGQTSINGGTFTGTAYIGTANYTFTHNAVLAATDSFYLKILPTYNAASTDNLA
jgi:hypothetical protein